MIYFPDTNYFLHFKNPSDAPWSDLTKDDHVRLAVCRTVQREIDKKKHELKGRQQKRARRFQTVFRQIIQEDKPAELRSSAPRVTLELYLRWPASWQPPPELDVDGWGDDALVADLLAFKEANPSEEFALLTGDTGILATAKHFGISAVPLDGEDWELPEEPDTRDKKITKLEQEVHQLRQRGPKIEFDVTSDDHNSRGAEIEVVRYSSLSGKHIGVLIQELEEQFPLVTVFDPPQPEEPDDWAGPTEEAIAAYRERYDNWIREAHELLGSLHGRVQKSWFMGRFTFVLSNVGVAPATRFTIGFETTDGFLLRDLDKADDDVVEEGLDAEAEPPELGSLRPAPTAPEWKKVRKVARKAGYRSNQSLLENMARQFNTRNQLGILGAIDPSTMAAMSLAARSYRDPFAGIGGLSDRFAGIGGLGDRNPNLTIAQLETFKPALVAELVAARHPEPRDPNAFFWKSRPSEPLSKRWEFECEEFRHQGKPEVWNIGVVVELETVPENGGAILIEAHAQNLREPFKVAVPVRIRMKDEDTEAFARSLLRTHR